MRPLLTVGQVYALADACGPRYYAMVLLACFCGPRWGELAAPRRRDIDTATATVRITRQLSEVNGQAPLFAPPRPRPAGASSSFRRRICPPSSATGRARSAQA